MSVRVAFMLVIAGFLVFQITLGIALVIKELVS